jgi:hypothetical protein
MKGWRIFILAIVIYGVGVFGGFIQDDVKVIASDPDVGRVSAVASAFTRPYYYQDGGTAGAYRPVTSASFYLNALLTGKEAWGFRLVNNLLYAGFCWLVFEVLKKFTSVKTAFWGTMIFTVLPIHTEAVNNIVGRGEILSLGFVLLAMLTLYKKRWEMSAGMFLLALLSKETAIVGLPILLYLLILGKEDKNTKIGVTSFYVLVTMSYFVLRMMVLGVGGMGNNATMVENPLKFVTTEQRVMNAMALVPFGVSKVIFPLNLSYDYSFNQLKLISSWFDWRVILGTLMMIVSVGSLFTSLRKNKLWILGQALFWGSLVVTGNFLFSVGTIFGERLWFWPSLGMVMMITSIFTFRKDFKGLFLVIIIVVIFILRIEKRNIDWLSQERLFVHDASYAKESVMAQSNAAAMYLMKKDLVKGKEYLEKAEAIYPKYPELMNNWGMYYLWSGEKVKAKEKFEECLVEKPGFYLCESNIMLLK